MSCYEWEGGTIQLPKAKFGSIYKEFVSGYNSLKEYEFTAAQRLRQWILDSTAGKRGVNYEDLILENYERFGVSEHVAYLMCGQIKNGKKPPVVTRKLMEFANGATTSFTASDESGISFDKSRKTVSWFVAENNHSRDRAHESKVAQLFFRILRNVKWTRGSGGTIVGNDEYNQDDHSAGGGANYVIMTFGD